MGGENRQVGADGELLDFDEAALIELIGKDLKLGEH